MNSWDILGFISSIAIIIIVIVAIILWLKTTIAIFNANILKIYKILLLIIIILFPIFAILYQIRFILKIGISEYLNGLKLAIIKGSNFIYKILKWHTSK